MKPEATKHLDAGKQWYKERNYEKALESFEEANAISPDSAEIWTCIADCQHQLDRVEEAKISCEKALELDANWSRAWHRKGALHQQKGELNSALEASEKAIELNPDFSYGWNLKGTVLYSQGFIKESFDAFEYAINIDSNDAYSITGLGIVFDHTGDSEKALNCFLQAISLDPDFAEPLYRLGLVYFTMGKFEESLEVLRKATKLMPYLSLPWSTIGKVLFSLEKYEGALFSINHALSLDPECHFAWFWKGLTLHKLTQHDEALFAISKSTFLDPYDPGSLTWKGIILRELGRYEEALSEFEKAANFIPNHSSISYNIGVIFDKTGSLFLASKYFLRTYFLDRISYFEYATIHHFKILELIPQPAWIQILTLYLPYLRDAASWSSMFREAEAFNQEAEGIRLAMQSGNFGWRNKQRVRAFLDYYLGNPFASENLLQDLMEKGLGTLESWYYFLRAKESYVEPLEPFQEQVIELIETKLASSKIKADRYWAGQLKYLLFPGGSEAVLTLFEDAGDFLPAVYMRMALVSGLVRMLEQELWDLEDDDMSEEHGLGSTGERAFYPRRVNDLQEGLESWQSKRHQVAREIYDLEKGLTYGEEIGYIRFVQQDTPMLHLGLADFVRLKAEYLDSSAMTRDLIGDTHPELRKHFWKTARTLLRYKTSLEIKEGLWAVESYVIEFPESPLARYVGPRNLEKQLNAFNAVQLLHNRIGDIEASNAAGFELQMKKLEQEPQVQELLAMDAQNILVTITARIEARYWQQHPNPNIGNHLLMYFFWRGDISQKDTVVLLMYQYLQQYGKTASSKEKWLKNGISFIVEKVADFFQVSSIYSILKHLGIIDLNGIIDSFFGTGPGAYQTPGFLTFKAQFEDHVTHLKETMGHDFEHEFPLPEGF